MEELNQSLYKYLLMVNIDVNTNEKTVLTLEEVESEQQDDHCNNLEMNLVPCLHCRLLKQEKKFQSVYLRFIRIQHIHPWQIKVFCRKINFLIFAQH